MSPQTAQSPTSRSLCRPYVPHESAWADLADDDDVVLGTHTEIEGPSDEILAYVDAACDPKTKSCGHAFTLSDGDCEHYGLGAFVPPAGC